MLLIIILFAIFVKGVASMLLDTLDPYDNNRTTKSYLRLGCEYLAGKQAERYESAVIQKKVSNTYSSSCMQMIWPKAWYDLIPIEYKCSLKCSDSFKRGDPLGYREDHSLLLALEDGHVYDRRGHGTLVFYYHRDKPQMKRDVLEKLPWPQDKNLLAYRDFEAQMEADLMRKRQVITPNVMIKLDNDDLKTISFANLKQWIHEFFDLSKYDPTTLIAFKYALNRQFPGIALNKLYRLGSRTRVYPVHNLFTILPPKSHIAAAYDPNTFEIAIPVEYPKFSTIIAEYEHGESPLCLVLSFDIIQGKQN